MSKARLTKNGQPVYLALGDPNAAAYTSIKSALQQLGKIEFRHEKRFTSPIAVSNLIVSKNYAGVIFPNPYGNERRLSIYSHCLKCKIPTVVFDRGGLPDSWFFDQGFNADSPSYETDLWDRPLTNSQEQMVSKYCESITNSEKTLEKQGDRIGGESLRKKLALNGKKVLFVPFQRPSDTTVKYFRGSLLSFEDFVEQIQMLQSMLNSSSEEWVVLCKKHPLENDRPSQNLNFVPDDTHVNDLLELCDAVCLINSGVGLLASIFGKPVYYFGDVYYGHPGLNKKVTCFREVFDDLISDTFLVNKEVRNRLIFHLTNRIYSFGDFETKLELQRDGSYRNVTYNINFSVIRFNDVKMRNKSTNILFVTSTMPVPITKGSAHRTNQVLHALRSLDCNIDIAILNAEKSEADCELVAQRVTSHFKEARVIVYRHERYLEGKKNRGLNYVFNVLDLLRKALSFKSSQIVNNEECPVGFRRGVIAAVEVNNYDIVFFNYVKVSIQEVFNMNVETIVDTHDVQTRRIINDVAPKWPFPLRNLLIKRFRRSEIKWLRKYDKILAISDLDEKEIRESYAPGKDIAVLPVTFFDFENVTNVKSGKYDLLFVGSNSAANVASILWFLEVIWPNILAKRPETNILIKGEISKNTKIRSFLFDAESSNIYMEDASEDIEQAYTSSKIVICPTVKGTGMKVKVIEALRYGKVVVGTDIAFEGIKIESGRNAVCVDADQDMKFWILKLLDDSNLRESIAKEAKLLFHEYYEFDNAKKILSEFLQISQLPDAVIEEN
ncbi:glycosyltransferase [Oceanihabitans sediminis]|uniref:glycosyltransferase n=1 Tax=Oceanihabitans sediminis TaxID=1812012 RepID=UPI003A8EA4EF